VVAVAARFGSISIGLTGGPKASFFTIDEIRANVLPVGGFIQAGPGGVPVGIANAGTSSLNIRDDRWIPFSPGQGIPNLTILLQDLAGAAPLQQQLWELRAVQSGLITDVTVQSQVGFGPPPESFNFEASIANQPFSVGFKGRLFLKGNAL
jgi:hypothetical protein